MNAAARAATLAADPEGNGPNAVERPAGTGVYHTMPCDVGPPRAVVQAMQATTLQTASSAAQAAARQETDRR